MWPDYRKSAYDVFAPGLLSQAALQAAAASAQSQPMSMGVGGPMHAMPPGAGGGPMQAPIAPTRRSSFRIAGGGDSLSKDNITSPERSNQGGLLVDEERKMRRRGSQL